MSTTTTYKSKIVSSDSTVEEVNQAAMEWCLGKLDVLITTTMGLVGNENPLCRYLVCVGYLYDSMQIVQALGRLRNYMRLSHGQVLFAVPDMLGDHRVKDDKHQNTRLLNEKFVSPEDHSNFQAIMTSSGVCDWLVSTSEGQGGCAMKTLLVAFGRHVSKRPRTMKALASMYFNVWPQIVLCVGNAHVAEFLF